MLKKIKQASLFGIIAIFWLPESWRLQSTDIQKLEELNSQSFFNENHGKDKQIAYGRLVVKAKITPTQHEVELNDDDIIISKTDLKGRITYANRTFMRIANYSEKELLRQQHNIVRHPDMPRGTFKLLWDTLETKQEFFAYVKNITSEGHYYWVFANVTPDFDDQGKVAGYFSVRRKTRPSAVASIESIYREMLEAERRAGPAKAMEASIALLEGKLKNLGTTYEHFILNI